MYKEPLLHKLNRKFGRYAPRNLMTIIIIGTGMVWLLDWLVYLRSDVSIIPWLWFDKELILQGEVWRLVSFIFVPEESDFFYLAIYLYFYWLIGDSLETEWGAFRFDLFYFLGIIGAIASGMFTDFATNYYVHLSLFLAFAILNPDYQLLVFFFIPVKVKYLAILDFISLLFIFIFSGWAIRISVIMAMLNILLFFGKDFLQSVKNYFRRRKFRRESKRDDEDGDYPFDL